MVSRIHSAVAAVLAVSCVWAMNGSHLVQAQGQSLPTVGDSVTPANLDSLGPDESTEKQIQQLILRLGDRSYRNREKAEKELRALGLLALESLQAAEDHEDIEIRIRARNLVSQMRGRMIAEGVPPELADLLRDYDKLPRERRQQLISSLSTLR